MRPEEIRAQISSLNDELKNTLKEVNACHSERDLLLKQIDDLRFSKVEAERLYNEEKDRLASIRYPQEQQIKTLKEQLRLLEVEQEVKKAIIQGLIQKEVDIRERIKNLKEDKKKLQVIRAELEEAEKNRPLIETIKKELLETIDKFNEAKVDLDVVVRERERTINTSNVERNKHLDWLNKTRTEVEQRNKDSVNLRIEWEKKLKDLKVVEKRLKKLWTQNSKLPFPKTYYA